MCDFCGNSLGFDYLDHIISGKSETIKICPNCVVSGVYYNTINFPEGNFISEISGAKNAIEIKEQISDETYYLSPNEAKRLFCHMLMPEEYNILLTNHDNREYMLHDDFYDEEGNALQPIDEERYEQFLENKRKNFLNECVENNLNFKETNNFINLIDSLKG